MALIAEVTENGVLRVKSPDLKPGDEITLQTCSSQIVNSDKGNWEDIEKVFEKIDKLDFPRRTPDDILRDLHEIKG